MADDGGADGVAKVLLLLVPEQTEGSCVGQSTAPVRTAASMDV